MKSAAKHSALALATAAILAVAPIHAGAQVANPLVSLPEGQTILNISATETAQVQQDLLVATVRVERQGKDPKALQDDINKTIKAALEKAKQVASIKISTEQYYVYPIDQQVRPVTKDGQQAEAQERVWNGGQSIRLESADAQSVLKLTGELQAMGLTVTNLNYQLSTDMAATTADSLMEKALAKVTAKADRAAKALGRSKSSLLEVSVDSNSQSPQPFMMRAEMAKSASAVSTPSAEPGMTEINLTVNARALLKE